MSQNYYKYKHKVLIEFSSFSTNIIFILFTKEGLSIFDLLKYQIHPLCNLSPISVNCSWPGNEAMVIEQEVTSKFEAAFAQIGGIKDINSC